MIKGVIFDIDETLYSNKLKEVPLSTYKLLKKLKEKGILLCFCTSRSYGEMYSLPSDLFEYFDLKITSTGAYIESDDASLRFKVNKQVANKYIEYFTKHNLSYYYTDVNGLIYYWGDREPVLNGSRLANAKGKVIFKEYEESDNIVNLLYFDATLQEEKEIEDLNPYDTIACWPGMGNICAEKIDKGFGVKKFCELYDLKPEEIIACGDGTNDELMMYNAGIGIAMYNSKPIVKEAADYICEKPLQEDGLYEMFVKLGIIDGD